MPIQKSKSALKKAYDSVNICKVTTKLNPTKNNVTHSKRGRDKVVAGPRVHNRSTSSLSKKYQI
jgi:hypothetical protein